MARELKVALTIQADLDQAVKEVAQLDASLDKLGTSSRATASTLNSTAAAADRSSAAMKGDATAASAAATAHGKLAPAANASAAAMQRTALSAKQLQMAQRQLPMQITDIATGLASGQSPFMVAIQQGGQLRDSFGGIGPAARALVGAINPVTIAVAAGAATFGLIAKALVDGYQEMQAYERVLISTGNIAGTTAGRLADVANTIGDSTGRYAEADAAVLALAQSGKLTGEALELAAAAAVNLATLTGMSSADAAEQISKLATEPSKAIAKLNESYHFLTASTYEQIVALEKQGKTQEAVELAVRTFADVHEQRVQEAIDRAGYLERAWKGLGSTIRGVWDSIKDGGRTDAEYRLRVAQQQLEHARSMPAGDPNSARMVKEAEARVAAAQAELNRLQQIAAQQAKTQAAIDAAVAASQKADAEAKSNWEARERSAEKRKTLEQQILQIQQEGARLQKPQAEIDAQIAAARRAEAERARSGGSTRTAKAPATEADRSEQSAQRELDELARKTAMVGALEEGEKRLSEVERIRYEITQGAYRAASEATKRQLLEQAELLDAANQRQQEAREEQQEYEKTARAYEQLSDKLRTPVEVAVETATQQIEILNAALEKGIITKQQYDEQMGRVVQGGFEPPPQFQGISAEVGGPSADQMRLDQARAAQEQWYAEQLAILEQYRAQRIGTEQQWNEQEFLLEQQHQQRLEELARAQAQINIAHAQSMFGSMAELAKTFAGEQSQTYKVLFAISKAFAVAQAAIALAQNVAEASKIGFPQNIPLIAGALAQGAQIASLLSAAQFASGGHIRGPGTGTSDSIPILASNDEYMVRARSVRQPGALSFLDDFNARGMDAVRDWRGYAEGGLVTAREPRLSEDVVQGASAKGSRSSLVVGITDDLVVKQLDTGAGDEVILKRFSRNPARFRGALGL